MSQKKPLKLGFADTFGTAINFFKMALSTKYDVVLDHHDPDYLIFGDPNFGISHFQYTRAKKIFYTGENVPPDWFTYNHAMTFGHENSPRHYRLPLYVLEMWSAYWDGIGAPDHLLKKTIDPEEELRNKSRFCSYVQTNPNCEMRTKFVTFMQSQRYVDCGGPHLNNIGHVLPRDNLKHKLDFIRTRKFNIAFENGSSPGYVTEKLLNAFYANTVPIYWGSSTVARDFNPKAFINAADYKTFGDVWDRVWELNTDHKKYMEMLAEPAFIGNMPNEWMYIDNFLDWFDTFVYEG